MNGKDLKLFKALLDEKFTNLYHRLNEVKSDTEKMDGKLDKLPCGVMGEKIKGINGKLLWIWAIIILIIGAIIKTGLAK